MNEWMLNGTSSVKRPFSDINVKNMLIEIYTIVNNIKKKKMD
jgi:hypothetical protein